MATKEWNALWVREYLITLCAFDDGDVVPTCNFAAIKPPDELPNNEVPGHVQQLLKQIAEEQPVFLAEAYGVVPPPHARFWEMAPNPVEIEEGGRVVPWLLPISRSSSS